MTGYFFALGLIFILVILIVVLLRKRRLREKYAAIWLVLAVGVCIAGASPTLIASIASLVGVETPSNLLFAVAILVLLLVCIQLSVESSTLEEEVRTVAEQLALVSHRVEVLERAAKPGEASKPRAPPAPADSESMPIDSHQ